MHGKCTACTETPLRRGIVGLKSILAAFGCESSGTHVASCCHASANPGRDDAFVCSAGAGKDYRGFDWFSNGVPDFSANGTRSAELIRQSALKFLQKRADVASPNDHEPFFLYLPFQNIHAPYDVHDAYADRYAMIRR